MAPVATVLPGEGVSSSSSVPGLTVELVCQNAVVRLSPPVKRSPVMVSVDKPVGVHCGGLVVE
jgi:hypothetical protein